MPKSDRFLILASLIAAFGLASCGSGTNSSSETPIVSNSESTSSSSENEEETLPFDELPSEASGEVSDAFPNISPITSKLDMEPTSVYLPSTKEEINGIDALSRLPDVVILSIDDKINIVDGEGAAVSDFATYFNEKLADKVIPAVQIDTLELLYQYLSYIRSTLYVADSYIVSSNLEVLLQASKDPLASRCSLAYDATAAKLEDDDDYYLIEAASTAVNAQVVILDENNATLREAVEWFNARFKCPWVKASDGTIGRAILSGAYGVMTNDVETFYSAIENFPIDGTTRKPFLAAHRGLTTYGVYNENSLPAITDAYMFGATHVEIDLQITKDNVVVVCHDDSPAYFSDEVPSTSVRFIDNNWDDLKDYNLTDNGVAVGNKIPTLEEVLTALKGTPTIVMLEMKLDWCSDKALAKEPLKIVEEIVRKTGMEKQVLGITYYPPFAQQAREASPWMPIATIGYGPSYNLEYVSSEDPQGAINYFHKYQWALDYSSAGTLYSNADDFVARGFTVNSYTFNDLTHFKSPINIATTNKAEDASSCVAELNPETYLVVDNAAEIPSVSTIKATTYSHNSKDVTANLMIIEGDVETDPYLTATYSYTDSRSGKGIYSEPVTIANLALGASATDETEYKEKPGIELPGVLQSAVYGA